MIISKVQIQWLSDSKGYGLVATQKIPKGTVTFVQDGLDIVIKDSEVEIYPTELQEHIHKYSYEDYLGNRIVSWDLAKYMNHDDNANTLTTGYGFEIAIKDIEEGEEVTDDYRIFSTHHDTTFNLLPGPLKDIKPWPIELIQYWDQKIEDSLKMFYNVEQPLFSLIPKEQINELERDLKGSKIRSVQNSLPLRYKKLVSQSDTSA